MSSSNAPSIVIAINSYWRKKCKDFANQQIEGSRKLYAYRGEKNTDKMNEDIVIGKMVEVAVWQAYKHLGATKPDFTIYERINKSFAADMMIGEYTLHVKGQGHKSLMNYGESFLFQKTDPIVRKPTLHDIIVVGLVCPKLYRVTILASFNMYDVVENGGLEQPRNEWYARTKYAIYLKNLRDLGINMNVLSQLTKDGLSDTRTKISVI